MVELLRKIWLLLLIIASVAYLVFAEYDGHAGFTDVEQAIIDKNAVLDWLGGGN